MAVSDDGHIYLAGTSGRGDIDFGNGHTTSTGAGSTNANRDIWTAIYDASGNCLDVETDGDANGAQSVYDLAYNETNQELVLSGRNDAQSVSWKFLSSSPVSFAPNDNFILTWDVSSATLSKDDYKDFGSAKAPQLLAEDGNNLYLFINDNVSSGTWQRYLERYNLSSLNYNSTPAYTSSQIILPSSSAGFPFNDMEARLGKLYIIGNTSGTVKLAGSGSTSSQQVSSQVTSQNGTNLWVGFIARYDDQLSFEAAKALQPAADAGGYAVHPLLYSNIAGLPAMQADHLAVNDQGEAVVNFTALDIDINGNRYYAPDNQNIAAVKFDVVLNPVWCNFTTGDRARSLGSICLDKANDDEYFVAYYVQSSNQQFDLDTVTTPTPYFSLFIKNIEDEDTAAFFEVMSDTHPGWPVKQVELYPNPNIGKFTVQCPSYANLEAIIVADLAGKTVFRENYKDGYHQKQIKLPELAPGIYFVKVDMTNGHKVFQVEVH